MSRATIEPPGTSLLTFLKWKMFEMRRINNSIICNANWKRLQPTSAFFAQKMQLPSQRNGLQFQRFVN